MDNTITFKIKWIDGELWISSADPRGHEFCWRTSSRILYANMEEITAALENRYPDIVVAFCIE